MAAFARAWERRRDEQSHTSRGTFVPLLFSPGEGFQFDWSEDWAVVGGERQKLAVAQSKISHSRAFLLVGCFCTFPPQMRGDSRHEFDTLAA